ncbi:MAG: PilN domain-containing protein [Acidobacteria bacterium]|nr:PilN domain-containing protein [Acidobacteriota bacterium]
MIRVNLLGVGRAKKKRAAIAAPTITLGGGRTLILLVVVLVAVAGMQYWRYRGLQSESAGLDTQKQQLEREKADLARIRAEYDTFSQRKDELTRRINIIEGLKAQQTGPINLLDMLSSTVSATDSLWLTAIEQAGQNLTIEGVALNARAVADFMTRLAASQMFSEVDLKEAFQDTSDRETVKFNFTLIGQLKAPASPAEAPQPGPA